MQQAVGLAHDKRGRLGGIDDVVGHACHFGRVGRDGNQTLEGTDTHGRRMNKKRAPDEAPQARGIQSQFPPSQGRGGHKKHKNRKTGPSQFLNR